MIVDTEIGKKLDYIGLNLDDIPEFLKDKYKVKYRPKKAQNEKNYRIYKYINVSDIDILITPTNRLTNINEKYEMAIPFSKYLNPENKELYETFLKLVKQISVDTIEDLYKQQDTFQNSFPLDVKFYKDYLWQIYYSEEENKYFMLAPITETEYAQIFYILKEQLSNSNKKIYVPICYADYTDNILTRQEIKNLENILFVFTNNWTSIYEVTDKNGEMNLIITGKTKVLETVKSNYIMKFSNREKALSFYNLFSALFTLQVNYPNFYNFHTVVLENGEIELSLGRNIINEKNISDFVNTQYKETILNINKLRNEEVKRRNEIEKLKNDILKSQYQFIEKQRQIADFIECKKTFFGKVKYFFKNKKTKKIANNASETQVSKIQKNDSNEEQIKEKNIYTLHELMEITSVLQNQTKVTNDLELDINAAKRRLDVLNKKIQNADLYIKEINSHKKSLLEFFRFTSKEEANALSEGVETDSPNHIRKSFNIDLDLEEIKNKFDELVRDNLSKDEIDAVFTTTKILEDINRVLKSEEIDGKNLKALKEELNRNKISFTLNLKDEKNTFAKQIEHREAERNIFSILNINDNTTLSEYKVILTNIIEKIRSSFNKININTDVSLYYSRIAGNNEKLEGFKLFSINPEEIIGDDFCGEINIYKIITKDNINYIPLSNIVYYNNLNKTLPLGMDCGTKVLVNTENLNINLNDYEQNNVLRFHNDKINIIKVNIYNKYR